MIHDAKLSAALSKVNLVQANVERLTTFGQFKEVRAPFTGTIVQRQIDVGDLVTAGSTKGNTPLYRMTQDDPIRVFVDAPQALAESMKVVSISRTGTAFTLKLSVLLCAGRNAFLQPLPPVQP